MYIYLHFSSKMLFRCNHCNDPIDHFRCITCHRISRKMICNICRFVGLSFSPLHAQHIFGQIPWAEDACQLTHAFLRSSIIFLCAIHCGCDHTVFKMKKRIGWGILTTYEQGCVYWAEMFMRNIGDKSWWLLTFKKWVTSGKFAAPVRTGVFSVESLVYQNNGLLKQWLQKWGCCIWAWLVSRASTVSDNNNVVELVAYRPVGKII